MKPRQLTAEERMLWRASNQHTVINGGADAWEVDEDDATSAVVPPPVGGRLGGGCQMAPSLERIPSPPLTRKIDGDPSIFRARSFPYKGGERPAAPLTPLTTREAVKRFKPYGAVEMTLDLHGLNKLEAYARVQHFIARAQRQGHRHVAIVTGKGRGQEIGVLRSLLPEWLNEPALRPLISGFAHAKPEKGGAGVTHVLLKRAS